MSCLLKEEERSVRLCLGSAQKTALPASSHTDNAVSSSTARQTSMLEAHNPHITKGTFRKVVTASWKQPSTDVISMVPGDMVLVGQDQSCILMLSESCTRVCGVGQALLQAVVL